MFLGQDGRGSVDRGTKIRGHEDDPFPGTGASILPHWEIQGAGHRRKTVALRYRKPLKNISDKKVVFFGCPLDSDERDESVAEKLSCMGAVGKGDDPYPFVMEYIREEVDSSL